MTAAPRSTRPPREAIVRAAITAGGVAGVALLLQSRPGFALLLTAAIFAGGYEFRAITEPRAGRGARIASGLAATAAGGIAAAAGGATFATTALPVIAFLAAVLGVTTLIGSRPLRPGIRLRLAGPIYFGALPGFLYLLHGADAAPRGYWVWLAIALSWGGGIGGFVAGRLWGRRPLAPAASPRKTAEGAIGALLLGCALGFAVWRTDPGALPFPTAAWLLPSAQLLSQAGDLVESRLKRRCGVDDSGRLLHAQGGMLDSLDGLCLAAPWLYLASGLPWR
ncbi:MAG TPA: phosphatidate cytidylyltransferase [Candidatus Eisenbacteria bacterium]|nr:phosphatidate cytidylyltransferase [Candidatus Eisenbacteria bacterium]